ncbi:hypothetical protein [Jiangella asiatica]|uniref:Uncharacterized protein n=1 Tax=Jiangella asiatica TaxID=2530372 RepID=A0A4R5CWM9_9ACTN|nr:hypothetical protein [Jiangella asiatica]TDE03441.1 hypothetical protein E1269_20600 [Jiangella asiatica]
MSTLPRPDYVTEDPSDYHHPGEPHTWFMPSRPEIVTRDIAGRRNPNSGRTWLVLPCNHWPCKAVRLVRVGAILRMAEDGTR